MNRKELAKKIEKNTAIIKNCESEIIRLSMKEELRNAAGEEGLAHFVEIKSKVLENQPKIMELSKKHFYHSVLSAFLRENYRYMVFMDACKELYKICLPFDGKPFGEKTKEKINSALHEKGFTFYFDGYSKTQYIKVCELNENGYTTGREWVEGYAVMETDKKLSSVFVTDENKLVFNRVISVPFVHLVDNPEKRAREVIRAYQKITKAEAELEKMHGEYNALLPERGLPRTEYFKKLYIRF